MTKPHLQDKSRAEWDAASDEEHVCALLNPPPFIDPAWMGYLKRYRPQALEASLRIHAAGGGYLGRPARRFLQNH